MFVKKMRMAALAILFISFSGCAEEKGSALTGLADWPFPEAVEVRAFRFDLDGQPGSLISRGSLAEDRSPHEGVQLSKIQTRKLRSLVVHGETPKNPSLCYMPHHGFIFYDATGDVLGYMEFSPSCFSGFSRTQAQMNGDPPSQDSAYLTAGGWEGLAALFAELGIPVGELNTE